jgi:ribosomal protein S17E
MHVENCFKIYVITVIKWMYGIRSKQFYNFVAGYLKEQVQGACHTQIKHFCSNRSHW